MHHSTNSCLQALLVLFWLFSKRNFFFLSKRKLCGTVELTMPEHASSRSAHCQSTSSTDRNWVGTCRWGRTWSSLPASPQNAALSRTRTIAAIVWRERHCNVNINKKSENRVRRQVEDISVKKKPDRFPIRWPSSWLSPVTSSRSLPRISYSSSHRAKLLDCTNGKEHTEVPSTNYLEKSSTETQRTGWCMQLCMIPFRYLITRSLFSAGIPSLFSFTEETNKFSKI